MRRHFIRTTLASAAVAITAAATASSLYAQNPATGPAEVTIVPVPETKLPLKFTGGATSAAITAHDLMTRLYIFADDSMMGREAGTLGNVKGTDYIASEAKRMGFIPMGENGTYFQTIPFKTRTVDPSSSISVNGAPLAFGSDWVVSGAASIDSRTVPVIFGGTLGDSAHMITADQANGKLVVLLANAAATRRIRGASMAGAAGIIVVGLDQFMPFFNRPTQFVDDPSLMAGRPTPPPTIIMSSTAAPRLFNNAALATLAPGTAGANVTVTIKQNVVPTPYPARNVVAMVRGSDPKLAGEFVAIGGHNDHIGMNNRPVDHDSLRIFNHIVRPGGAEQGGKQATPAEQAQVNALLAQWRAAHPNSQRADSISNGADDDGTGSVSVLEIAEKIASLKGADRPKRSILFVWHVGEEKGLLGSAYYTDHPTVTRDSIVAQLNIDMVGRGDAWDVTGDTKEGAALHGSPNYLQLVGSRRLSTELGNLAETVNTGDKHGLAFDYAMDANGHPMNIYCRSDHYEYARYNIPIIFFTTGGHSDYHQVTDEPQYIDYDHMARIDNFIEDLAIHVADLDHRPVVDGPKMDPRGACRQ